MVFQIVSEDLVHMEFLRPSDVGTWCYLNRGCVEGFYATKEEAEARAKQVTL